MLVWGNKAKSSTNIWELNEVKWSGFELEKNAIVGMDYSPEWSAL